MMTRLLGALGIFVAISLMSACAANSPSSPSKNTQVTWQAQLAIDLGYGPLWPGIQPSPANGINRTNTSQLIPTGWLTLKPALDELQISDLLDRGVSPGQAIVWMNTYGYPTAAKYLLDDPNDHSLTYGPTIRFPLHDMLLSSGWILLPRGN